MFHGRTWRKTTYSTGQGDSACVEVSITQDALVRDSKATRGDVLAFSIPAWRAFVASVA